MSLPQVGSPLGRVGAGMPAPGPRARRVGPQSPGEPLHQLLQPGQGALLAVLPRPPQQRPG